MDVPFVRGSDTSEAAAIRLDPESLEAAVFAAIARSSNGCTDDEIEVMLQLSHQTTSARRRTLVLKHRVRDSGLRRQTRSGRQAVVWVAGTSDVIEGASLDKRPKRPEPVELRQCLREISELVDLGKQQGRQPSEALRRVWAWLAYVAREG